MRGILSASLWLLLAGVLVAGAHGACLPVSSLCGRCAAAGPAVTSAPPGYSALSLGGHRLPGENRISRARPPRTCAAALTAFDSAPLPVRLLPAARVAAGAATCQASVEANSVSPGAP